MRSGHATRAGVKGPVRVTSQSIVKPLRPKPAPKYVIDQDALAEAKADLDRAAVQLAVRSGDPLAGRRVSRKRKGRKATGRCLDCDRRVSGQREFCGPCAARRS